MPNSILLFSNGFSIYYRGFVPKKAEKFKGIGKSGKQKIAMWQKLPIYLNY